MTDSIFLNKEECKKIRKTKVEDIMEELGQRLNTKRGEINISLEVRFMFQKFIELLIERGVL